MMALKYIKDNKAPASDRIATELIKEETEDIIGWLYELFYERIKEGTIPGSWIRDKLNLEIYGPISLLSQIYKLFSIILTKRHL